MRPFPLEMMKRVGSVFIRCIDGGEGWGLSAGQADRMWLTCSPRAGAVGLASRHALHPLHGRHLVVEGDAQLEGNLPEEQVRQCVRDDAYLPAVAPHLPLELRRHLHDDPRHDSGAWRRRLL